jgi:hypothetical protein
MRSGELYFVPSYDDVYRTVNDFTSGENQAYMSTYLRPMSSEKSAVYITCELENPRSFVWVTKSDDSEPFSSGRCHTLDVRGPPFDNPSAKPTGIGLETTFTESSIMDGLNRMDDRIRGPLGRDSETVP